MATSDLLMERETKLPVWAQDVLIGLRRELAEARATAERALLQTDPEGSDAVIRRWTPRGSGDIGLGKDIVVAFKLGGDWNDTIDVRLERESGLLVVHGDRSLMVRPQASNSIIMGLSR